MQLFQIQLVHFKNYAGQSAVFSPRLNGLVGQNGMGKTNMLDAIYYLCMGKSYFSVRDQYLVQHGEEFFRLVGQFAGEEREDRLVVKVIPRQRKELELNGRVYEKLAEHVGRFPVVIVVPDDTQLIKEGSEERRRFLNNTLSQLDQEYLQHLLQYNKILKQRNALLKQWGGRMQSEDLLLIYDQQLAKPAQYIHARRAAFIEQFQAPFQEAHQAICGGQEEVVLSYRSALTATTLADLLQERREKDVVMERTTQGIHRDDLVFKLDQHPLKRLGSQGQLKSFVLALKLAQYRFLQEERKVAPILLLDDIFDKLDPQRVEQLVSYILREDFGQIFISDTDQERITRVLRAHPTSEPRLFQVVDGTVEEQNLVSI
ncbi:MAG: DNA replication/repair protein RecF [Bacteroidota bacterium]